MDDPSRDDESLLGRRKWWHVKNYFGLTFNHDILGNTPIPAIRDYIPDLDHNDIKSLKNKNIMFMDQLTTANGYFLFNWNDVKRNNLNNYTCNIPKWFKRLEDYYILSNKRTLTHPIKDTIIIINRLHKPLKTKIGFTYPKNEWTVHWHNLLKNAVFGKTLSQDTTKQHFHNLYGTLYTSA
ncbi:hypothetical protein RhiirC2_716220 [Rhizophagus irregularis]|uniref:Uncharacterized protein n=1 Tax=Rhizophagus irregularis TaxID=588596 RepID=A0A2N1MSE5_9GLOM|nr:hypothetical protein RhiirC2_716220 [Rhizophagus irregularis]